jgi:hypothetical protein
VGDKRATRRDGGGSVLRLRCQQPAREIKYPMDVEAEIRDLKRRVNERHR